MEPRSHNYFSLSSLCQNYSSMKSLAISFDITAIRRRMEVYMVAHTEKPELNSIYNRNGWLSGVAGVRRDLAVHVKRAGLLVGCISALVAAAPAQAATQGVIGATSTGSVQITVSVPSRVQITGLTDISLANADPSSAATSPQNTCVWSNTATKGYTITATGSGTAGAFTLASGGLAPVTYAVAWNQQSGQPSGTSLTPATASTGFVSTAVLPGCATAPTTTSTLIVSITSAQLQTMASLTNYTGTLTLLVNPV